MATAERLDVVTLSQLPRSSRDEQPPNAPENDIAQESGRRESERRRILVLAGSALSQLPIWGTPHLSACISYPHNHRFRYELWYPAGVLS